jgi:regulatory protein
MPSVPHRRPELIASADAAPAALDAAAEDSDPTAEIRSRALKLLTTREHSRLELGRKLCARGYPAAEVETVLDQLIEDGLLSEERLLAAYVEERLGKGFGPLRIRSELRAKGLSDAAIDPHLSPDDERNLALMAEADAAKFGDKPANDAKTLAKRARFLEYRGFPSHLIARLLRAD